MKKGSYFAIPRAWIRQTIRGNKEFVFGQSGPKIKLSFELNNPIETRNGIDPHDNRPFYESDKKKLFDWYYGYQTTREYMEDLLYAEVLPIRADGTNSIAPSPVNSKEIKVIIEPFDYNIPELLRAHGDHAVDLFIQMKRINYDEKTKAPENNTSLRVMSIDPDGKLLCQKARYFDQVGTNITIDWRSGVLANKMQTIRIDVEPPTNGMLRPLKDSILANTLGVAMMLYSQELKPIVRVRSDLLASISYQGLHCTASGVHEVDPCQSAGQYDYSILERGMIKEIKDEIGLDENEYALFPIVFARELPRGGKPQLFFIGLANVDDTRIGEAMASAVEKHEYIYNDIIEAEKILNGSEMKSDLFTYEGWACLKYAEIFVHANYDLLYRRSQARFISAGTEQQVVRELPDRGEPSRS